MSAQKSNENNLTISLSPDHPQPTQRMVQNFFLVWLNDATNQSTQWFQDSLTELRSVVNDVSTFTQQDDAIDFLTDISGMSAFLIVTDKIGAYTLPLIHDIPHLDSIYILHHNDCQQQWTQQWVKMKGIHTDISSICQSLQLATHQCDHDSIPVSFITTSREISAENINRLEPSFMYTQLFKEILLKMENENKSIKILTDFCRRFYKDNRHGLKIIDEFEGTYRPESAIWWYTRECFVYNMLNRAFRLLEGDTIINMGFFICDLHRQIQQLHSEQAKTCEGKPFFVYRGQGLLKMDFEKLTETKGGLMSFNSFLSTSRKQETALRFVQRARTKSAGIVVLFRMTIDPSIMSTPFASIEKYSSIKTEEEILFSMHTTFRVDGIEEIHYEGPLRQVNLKLTADDDIELRTLTDRIRQDLKGPTILEQLGNLLIQLRQLDQAEEVYATFRPHTSGMTKDAVHHHQLGQIKTGQGDYKSAIQYYQKALEILEKTLPANHLDLAACYSNMGLAYRLMGEYSKALLFFEKNLEIKQKTLPANHPSSATCYGNMAGVYRDMGEYSKALLFFEKNLEIQQKTLPANHPDLATCYGNMAGVYKDMGAYSNALSFYEKTLEIFQKTLPANHPDLATCYGNMGLVYSDMGEYSNALSFHEKGLEIYQKTLAANHPLLATCYSNIAGVYCLMGDYPKALSFYEKDLEICQKTLPANHPHLAECYGNTGFVYRYMGKYSKALSFHEKGLEICQKSLPTNHPSLATCYSNMGLVHRDMGEYSKALSFYERNLKSAKKLLLQIILC